MPTYFFNVTDGHAVSVDLEGTELLDKQAARVAALDDARALMSDSDRNGYCRRHWQMNVVDEADNLILSLPFADALKPALLVASPRQTT